MLVLSESQRADQYLSQAPFCCSTHMGQEHCSQCPRSKSSTTRLVITHITVLIHIPMEHPEAAKCHFQWGLLIASKKKIPWSKKYKTKHMLNLSLHSNKAKNQIKVHEVLKAALGECSCDDQCRKINLVFYSWKHISWTRHLKSMVKIIQRLETGRFSPWGNISSGIWDHQSKDLQAGTSLWSTAWPGRSTTTHRCFKTCLIYKLFHPSVTREVNSIYMRQPAIITRLTENTPLSLPAHPSATWSRPDVKDRPRHSLHWTGCPPWFHLIPLKPTADPTLARAVCCTYLCEHVLLPSHKAGQISCFHTLPCQS